MQQSSLSRSSETIPILLESNLIDSPVSEVPDNPDFIQQDDDDYNSEINEIIQEMPPDYYIDNQDMPS